MQWNGDEAKLQQVCRLFVLAGSRDNNEQQQVMQQLNNLSQMDDFPLYLATVFARMSAQDEVIRQRAGLLLKTNIARLSDQGRLAPQVGQYVQAAALEAVQDQSRIIRHTAGTVIATIVQKQGILASSHILDKLCELILKDASGGNAAGAHIVEGCLNTLNKVIEDLVMTLKHWGDSSEQTYAMVNWCSERLLPCVITHAKPTAEVSARQNAVECLNHFALNGVFTDGYYPAMSAFAPKYVEILGVLANDTDTVVLRHVCKGFVSTVDGSFTCLSPQECNIILQFMLKASRHSDYDVRAEALEIWAPCTRVPPMLQLVHPMLPDLVPVLLANMVYSTADYMMMEQSSYQDDNATEPDQAQDIQPRFHKNNGEDLDYDEDEDESGGNGGGAWGADWTARKAAAWSLDNMSQKFPQDILPIVLPLIQQKLEDQNWEVQESGVLAIGAIAFGCMNFLVPYLPNVMEHLLKLCEAPRPLLRTISCWTASRFSSWICNPQNPNSDQVLKSVLTAFLQRVLDKNKRVQEAACSAFATLEEEARHSLTPYLPDIVNVLAQAFKYYQAKNLLILYDAVGTLGECVRGELDKPAFAEALLLPIMQRFEAAPDNDRSLVALFECLSALAQNISNTMFPLFPRIVNRCVRLILEGSKAAQMFQQNPNEFEKPDRDIMAAAIDLLAAIVEGLKGRVQEVLQQQNFLVVIPEALKDASFQVKQSTFALMGDCAKECSSYLVPLLPTLLPAAAETIAQGTSPTVSNNASWAIGEVCLRVPPDFMSQYLEQLVKSLVSVLRQPYRQQLLSRNICITLGRLGMTCGHLMGNMYPEWVGIWCGIMSQARHDEEKENAFQGLCNWIKANPNGCSNTLPQLLVAILSFGPPPPRLAQTFTEILAGYKQNMSARWMQILNEMAPDVSVRLRNHYGL